MSDFTFKYRPQKISELGLTLVRDGLTEVLKSGNVPHAFLFAGPRGTGKTSAARIVAKAINCLKKEKGDFEPCNRCDQCLSITTGNNLDVLEIDAASNRGIDDIRDLREKVKLSPTQAAYKLYIIDEVHMLTTEAFNALLKTLEEPPRHVVFVLCTTEPEKLPQTIISRCSRFNFKRASQAELLKKLEKIVEEEKLVASEEALKAIAKAASGSFRDSQKVLEQASFAGEKITLEKVEEILGQTVGLNPGKLMAFLQTKDVKGSLGEIQRVMEAGGNLRVYTEQLLEILRVLLLVKLGLPQEDLEVEPPSGGQLGVAELKTLIDIFSQAGRDLKEATIPQLPLELAIVEWCVGEKGNQEDGENQEKKGKDEFKNDDDPVEDFSADPTLSSQDAALFSKPPSLEDIRSRWKEILAAVKPRNYSLEALLRSTRPIDLSGRVLTLEVFYQFHKDKLENEKCRLIVEQVAKEILGYHLFLKYILGERVAARELYNSKNTTEFVVASSSDEVPRNGQVTDGPNGESADEDLLKAAKEIFSGVVE